MGWIAQATQNKGGLHRSLGVPEGKNIPESMVEHAASQGGKVGRQARLAITLRKLARRRKG